MRTGRLFWVAACAASMLAACTQAPLLGALPESQLSRLSRLLPADALLLGEQHDAKEHQQLQRQMVEWLAAKGTLAALTMEMAPRGRDTRALAPTASESQVRAALDWNEAGWPWDTYGPVVMAAVKAGIPVVGANLPTIQQRSAMQDSTLDQRLAPAALLKQKERIREGHCDLLPEAQILPMTRIQVARDISMAQSIEQALQPGRTVLLIAGNNHVERGLGVPAHMPAHINVKVISAKAGASSETAASASEEHQDLAVDMIWPTAASPAKDYCEQMRQMWGAAPSATSKTTDQGQ